VCDVLSIKTRQGFSEKRLMNIERYDIEAGKNILNALKVNAPGDYAQLMTQLKFNAGMAGLGQGDSDETPGFWNRIFAAGTGALSTIIDYRLQEEQDRQRNRQQQREYQQLAETELLRQAALAEQRQSQVLEYTNQMEFARQRQALETALNRSKGNLTRAAMGVGALVGLWLLYRAVA